MFYSYYRFKVSQVDLTTTNDFVTAPSGTLFEKYTGEVYIKTDVGVLDKVERYILSRDEQDQRYGTLDFGNIWSQSNVFNGSLTSTGTNLFTGANTFNAGALTIGSNIISSGSNSFSGVNAFAGIMQINGSTTHGGPVLFNGTTGFTDAITFGSNAGIISSGVNNWNATNNFNTSCAMSANTYAGHQTPLTTSVYDLGSVTKLWRSLHVSGVINAGAITATDYYINSNIFNNAFTQYRDFGNSAWRTFGIASDGIWKLEDVAGQHEVAHDGNFRTKTDTVLGALLAPINTTNTLDVSGATNFTGTVGFATTADITSAGTNSWDGINNFNLNTNFAAAAPITSLGDNTWNGTNAFNNALTISAGNLFTVNGTSIFNDIVEFTAPAAFVANTYAGHQTPLITSVYDLGSGVLKWNNIHANGTLDVPLITTTDITINAGLGTISKINFYDSGNNAYRSIGFDSNAGGGGDWIINDTTGVPETLIHTGNLGSFPVGSATSSSQLDTTLTPASETAMQYLTFVQTGTASSIAQNVKTAAALKYMPNTATLYATTFAGTATSALYADLAEKYDSDVEYPIGTVVEIGGSKEITEYNGGALAGVISENPGYMLNSDGVGQYVALKGKIPVICESFILKGQYCIASAGGIVFGIDKYNVAPYILDIVGVALENSVGGVVMVKV